ncbi:MAG: hypothetical protein A2X34_03320 [Elusimicrobia bacterium GWC2_51_8]|nr:MAG: hypothetical protein A2X34_03320 [Elusimicrobia bacterium GWC2_51_8]
MFNTVQIITSSEKNRLVLANIFKNLGADAVFSLDLNDTLSIFEKVRPKAVFLVDSEDPPSEIKLRELKRIAPFLPLVVLLKNRDASRAVALMKLGAFDCVQSPWTEEELRPVYKKTLNLDGTPLVIDGEALEKKKNALVISGILAALAVGMAAGWFFASREYNRPQPPPAEIRLPYSHPTGIAPEGDSLVISDWYTQALYTHNASDFSIKSVASLPEETPAGLTASPDALWLQTASGVIEKRLKTAGLKLLAKIKTDRADIAGICHDGLYFWIAYNNNSLSKCLPNDSLTELDRYPYPGKKIAAFACDTRFLWAADPGLKALVKMPLGRPDTLLSSSEIKQYSRKSLKITGLASKNGKIWFTAEDNGTGLVFSENEPK